LTYRVLPIYNGAMKTHEWIDHTSDVGLWVYGKDLQNLFKNAASAMFELVAKPLKNISQSHSRKMKVRLDTFDIEELLIRWLSELISLSDCKRLIFTKFEIQNLSDRHMSALITGQSRKYFTIETEIKAVTYHELKIQKKDHHYCAQIIFDV